MNEQMLSCQEVLDQLWEYLDGELDPETSRQIELHLEACACCFPQYDFRRAFREVVRRSGEGSVPPSLRKKVFQVLLEEDAGGPPGAGETPSGWWGRIRRLFSSNGA